MSVFTVKSWSEDKICQLILREVLPGNSMQRFAEMSQGLVGATHAGFADTMRAFEIMAG